jgi:hypothetical protein
MNWCTEYPEHFRLMTVFSLALIGTFSPVNIFVLKRSTFLRHATCSAITDGLSRYFRATLRYLIPTRLRTFALLLNHCYV